MTRKKGCWAFTKKLLRCFFCCSWGCEDDEDTLPTTNRRVKATTHTSTTYAPAHPTRRTTYTPTYPPAATHYAPAGPTRRTTYTPTNPPAANHCPQPFGATTYAQGATTYAQVATPYAHGATTYAPAVPTSRVTYTFDIPDASSRWAATTNSFATSKRNTATITSHTPATRKAKTATTTHTPATRKAKTATTTHTPAARKAKTATTTHTSAARKRNTATTTHISVASKRKATTTTNTPAANKRNTATTTTHTPAASKRKATTTTHSIDSAITRKQKNPSVKTTRSSIKRRRNQERYRNHPTLGFHHGRKDFSKVIREGPGGKPTLDLHGMTVSEAKNWATYFLDQHKDWGTDKVKVVTGRGNHTADGIPKIKPAIRTVLKQQGLSYREVAEGGCLVIELGDTREE